ncbi:MAG: dTDP-4-dehydrorhamnose 3,5-epimerase [bacterium]
MNFIPSEKLPGVIIIEPEIFEDSRGFFMEVYHHEKYRHAGIKEHFVQDNRAGSKKNTIRGLHYQIENAQGKLVLVLAGKIYDVAVDIRRNSPTFGKWLGMILSDENKTSLYIPPGFAHGYCVLSDKAEVLYKCTDLYAPQYERCIRWDDPALAIEWPVKEPILSGKDKNAPYLKDADLS